MARLLIVDDDLAVLEVLEELLGLTGHDITATNDSKHALKLIDDIEFQMVVTDLRMPHVDGLQIAQHVKAKNPSVPVILLTAYPADCEPSALASRWIDLLLPKPFDSEELMKSVERLMQQ